MRILWIEDDQPFCGLLKRRLEEEGFSIDVAGDGEEGDARTTMAEYDAIVLDETLPGEDALSLLQRWRRSGQNALVLLLTARDSVADKVRGLDLGADDCLSKPIEPDELCARLRALIRRGYRVKDSVVRIHDLEIDTSSRMVKRAGVGIRLTPKEYALLEFLANHRGRIVTRSMIWMHLYGDQEENSSNVVDVYIRYLRNKIDKDAELPLILTHRGKGYEMRGNGA